MQDLDLHEYSFDIEAERGSFGWWGELVKDGEKDQGGDESKVQDVYGNAVVKPIILCTNEKLIIILKLSLKYISSMMTAWIGFIIF